MHRRLMGVIFIGVSGILFAVSFLYRKADDQRPVQAIPAAQSESQPKPPQSSPDVLPSLPTPPSSVSRVGDTWDITLAANDANFLVDIPFEQGTEYEIESRCDWIWDPKLVRFGRVGCTGASYSALEMDRSAQGEQFLLPDQHVGALLVRISGTWLPLPQDRLKSTQPGATITGFRMNDRKTEFEPLSYNDNSGSAHIVLRKVPN